MRVHFIAIGGSAMHNLAIALKKKGFDVSGSDDEILEPSRSRLANIGILPEKEGWFPEKISQGIDAVILGMHARIDNPELLKAKELGLRIFSYPEYIYEQSKDKIRVVIGGSHGKTTITSIILHILRAVDFDFDYMVGAQLSGFDTMVKLTASSPVIILEGDEYLSSPIDRRPKFHLYKGNIGVISGIAWDHINVFPTFESYTDQFRIFAEQLPQDGTLIYCEADPEVKKLVESGNIKAKKVAYSVPSYEIKEGITFLKGSKEIPLQIFGEHNLMNLKAAQLVCAALGVKEEQFNTAIQSFTGAAKRLELIGKNNTTAIYKDFAHSPSKLKATTEALKRQYPNRKLVACMELHTFSSLNEEFLRQYKGSMSEADEAIVYFNPHTIAHKKLKPITIEQVQESFATPNIHVFNDSQGLFSYLKSKDWEQQNLLMMSSGNFDGMDLQGIASTILEPA